MEEDSAKKGSAGKDASIESSIEIEVVEGSADVTTYQRKNFRYTVEGLEDCWVIIESKKYRLYDVSKSGLGISAEADAVFQIGQCFGDVLTGCTLCVLGQTISGLSYKMIHISPHKGDLMICGLHWVNPEPDTLEAMESVVQALNDRIFKADNSVTE